MKLKYTPFALAFTLVAALPLGAHAQILGQPSGVQNSVSGAAEFADGTSAYGVHGTYGVAPELTLGAGYDLTKLDGYSDSYNTFSVGAAYDLSKAVDLGENVAVKPVAKVSYTSLTDGVSLVDIPVGVEFNASLPLAANDAALVPFVAPAFVHTRLSGETAGGTSETYSETNFGLSAGANLLFDRLFVGGLVNKVFQTGSNTTFGIQVGVLF